MLLFQGEFRLFQLEWHKIRIGIPSIQDTAANIMITLKSESDNKGSISMAASVQAFDRTELDSISDDHARLTRVLQTTLSLPLLLELFHAELAERLPLDGLSYTNPQPPCEYRHGHRARHSCRYRLALADTALGELVFYRRHAFSGEEVARLENYLCCLLYPLRNARLYHDALAQAHKDPLTGIRNRAALEENLASEVALARRHGPELALIVFDLDNFKQINDTHGHQRGDCAIKAAVQAALDCARDSDNLYRYGGEEFVMLLRNTDAQGACMLAERIRSSIENLSIECDTARISFTVSAGVASLLSDDSPDTLFDRADRALLQAKEKGRNRVVCANYTSPDSIA